MTKTFTRRMALATLSSLAVMGAGSAQAQAQHLLNVFRAGGEHQNGAGVLPAHFTADIKAVFARQIAVEHHGVRLEAEDAVHSAVSAPFVLHPETAFFHEQLQ